MCVYIYIYIYMWNLIKTTVVIATFTRSDTRSMECNIDNVNVMRYNGIRLPTVQMASKNTSFDRQNNTKE